ncbi:hypothetical protein OG249_17835 [Streptomyces microflavus]|uniref:hypothetical protein n=1 Tax=Streptomyces microflavus TaxID=1919 RepID=UPI00225A81F6|nr:hypothetical protein [Streptomyces microflavus]MCX4653749.1 hypothetical protein [Streptomyces microflavus]
MLGSFMPSQDGGHHAIKGFAFQFDASLIRLLDNPNTPVEVEGAQDIGLQNFHIQVKHRSSKYRLSEIAPAIRQMMQQFAADQSARFALYCHFSDREPGETLRLTQAELDAALGDFSDDYTSDLKGWFSKAFEINFAPDFETQFHTVLARLKKILRAESDSEALCWHAVIHHHVRDVILNRPPGDRYLTLAHLKDLVYDARAAVFEASYAQICGHNRYLQLLREQYKSSTAHVPPRERLFVIEYGAQAHVLDLVDIASLLRTRYFAGESPPPYIAFRGVRNLEQVKHALWQAREHFHDGFDYGGAEYSAASIVKPPLPGYGIKLIDYELLPSLLGRMQMHEVHDFYLTEPIVNPFSSARARHIATEGPSDLRVIFKGRK